MSYSTGYILVYIPYMKKYLSINLSRTPSNLLDQQQPMNKWLENSFSLSDWTTEESSIDEDSLKKDNKLVRPKTEDQRDLAILCYIL